METGIPQFWVLAVYRRLGQIGVYPCFFRLYLEVVRRIQQDKKWLNRGIPLFLLRG